MKRALIVAAVFVAVYAVLRELALREDFIAALGLRPLRALASGAFFALRAALLLLGPPLVAAGAWLRLTKS
jgi:hypothetical protein